VITRNLFELSAIGLDALQAATKSP
jgi:hypothetical protein